MDKYYLVPVTVKSVKYDDFSLNEMLLNINVELYERKVYAMALKYDESATSEEKELTNKIIEDKFKSYGIPEKIVMVKREESLYEIGTELPLTVTNDSYLDVFKIEADAVVGFFNKNENYTEEVSKFFTEFVKKSEYIKK